MFASIIEKSETNKKKINLIKFVDKSFITIIIKKSLTIKKKTSTEFLFSKNDIF
jgi:hypothetical protein